MSPRRSKRICDSGLGRVASSVTVYVAKALGVGTGAGDSLAASGQRKVQLINTVGMLRPEPDRRGMRETAAVVAVLALPIARP